MRDYSSKSFWSFRHRRKPPAYPQEMIDLLKDAGDADKFVKIISDYTKETGKKITLEDAIEITKLYNAIPDSPKRFEEIVFKLCNRLQMQEIKAKKDLRLMFLAGTALGFIALTIYTSGLYSIFRYKSSEYTAKVFEEAKDLLFKQKDIFSHKVEKFISEIAGLKEENIGLKGQIEVQGKEVSDHKEKLSDLRTGLEFLQEIGKKTESNVSALSDKYGELSIGHERLTKQFDEFEKRLNERGDIENLKLKEESKEFIKNLEKLLSLEYPD